MAYIAKPYSQRGYDGFLTLDFDSFVDLFRCKCDCLQEAVEFPVDFVYKEGRGEF